MQISLVCQLRTQLWRPQTWIWVVQFSLFGFGALFACFVFRLQFAVCSTIYQFIDACIATARANYDRNSIIVLRNINFSPCLSVRASCPAFFGDSRVEKFNQNSLPFSALKQTNDQSASNAKLNAESKTRAKLKTQIRSQASANCFAPRAWVARQTTRQLPCVLAEKRAEVN